MEEKEIRTLNVKVRGMDELITIEEQVFPFIEMGVVYLRMVKVVPSGNFKEFVIVRPDDIEYRIQKYSQEFMDEISTASDVAIAEQMARAEAEREISPEETMEAPIDINYG